MIARALMSRLTPDERAAFAAELAGEVSIDDQRNRAAGIAPNGTNKECTL